MVVWRDFINCFMFLIIGCVNFFGLLIFKVVIFVMGKVFVEIFFVRMELSYERYGLYIMDFGREIVLVFFEFEVILLKKRIDNVVDFL